MAFIGMRHVVAAPLTAHQPGSEPTYGTGFAVGLGMKANLTINHNDNPLYAEDSIAEDDNGITSMELELGVDDLTDEVEANMGLVKKVEQTTGSGQSAVTTATYYDTDEPAKDLGVGYMRVRQKGNKKTFQALWIFKTKFAKQSEEAKTKEEKIEWQTPTVKGRCCGLNVGGNGEMRFRKRRTFDTEAEAAAWLDELAHITP